MAEQFLDFPQVPTWLRRIVAAEWRNPWAVISPTRGSAGRPEPQIERPV